MLAEDFYAPTYLRMRSAYEAADHSGAIQEQVRGEGISLLLSPHPRIKKPFIVETTATHAPSFDTLFCLHLLVHSFIHYFHRH